MRRRHVREGWDAECAEMARTGDDRLLDGEVYATSSWDHTEWEWPMTEESALSEAGAPGGHPHQPEQPE